ncbi:DegV family protein [Desulfosediminicola ganghwensis]|uniref:DegV family protein n=1 Tax=Desulfosediminicola ganghwensis TaxID=2569540 RepID=UPI0010AB7DF4|nr:DegV family protein [Desulfosediminicola ganghwensis]
MGRIFSVVAGSSVEMGEVVQGMNDERVRQLLDFIGAGRTEAEVVSSGLASSDEIQKLLDGLVAEKIIRAELMGDRKAPILLITDSGADLPVDLIREKNIVMVPMSVIINGKKYLDRFDITPEQFYGQLRTVNVFPSTTPPSIEDFHRLFSSHIAEYDILGIFMSKKMSSTFEMARQAVVNNYNLYLKQRKGNTNLDKQFRIELVDSKNVSIGSGLLVLEAAEGIRLGKPIDVVKERIELLADKVRAFFMVDSLDYLARGGRIGHGSAKLGSFFGFKPILGMEDGVVSAKTKSFGGNRAKRKLVDYMTQELAGVRGRVRIGVSGADTDKELIALRDMILKTFPDLDILKTSFGPTVGSHIGPGAMGIAWLPVGEWE